MCVCAERCRDSYFRCAIYIIDSYLNYRVYEKGGTRHNYYYIDIAITVLKDNGPLIRIMVLKLKDYCSMEL